jgi:hypothetical protein
VFKELIRQLHCRRYLDGAYQPHDRSELLFSHAAGCYKRGFMLELSHSDPETQIVYSLDGSEPDWRNLDGSVFHYKNSYPEKPGEPFAPFHKETYSSFVYRAPIKISDRSGEPNRLSTKSSTVHRDPDYFPGKPVLKCTVVKAAAFKYGELRGKTHIQTYVVGAPARGRNLPIWLITIPEDDLFDYYKGIYTAGAGFDEWRRQNPDNDGKSFGENYRGRGEGFIRLANLEIIEPDRPEVVCSTGCAMSIYGASSRRQPIKSLFFQFETSENAEESIGYNPFSGAHKEGNVLSAVDVQHLMLRTGGGSLNYLNDHCAQSIMAPVFPGIQRGRNALHYINGEYFGLVQVREYQDRWHIARNFGVAPDNVVILHGVWGRGEPGHVEVGDEGDLELYRPLYETATQCDMTDHSNKRRVEEMIDLENYFNYLIMFIYFANGDWRGNKHFRFWRARQKSDDGFGDGRWRVLVWDFDDRLWGGGRKNYLETAMHPEGGGDARPFGHPERTALFRGLMQNRDLRNRFINQFADHLNTILEPKRVERIVRTVMGELKQHVEPYYTRWRRNPATSDCYKDYLQFAQHRPRYQREHIAKCFGLEGPVEISVRTMGRNPGVVRVNSVLLKSTFPGVGHKPYPWRGAYFPGISLRLEAFCDDGKVFDSWQIVSNDGQLIRADKEEIIELVPHHDLEITAIFR